MLRASFVVFDRDMAGLLVFSCVRVDAERSRPGRLDGGGGALREDEGVMGEAVIESVRAIDCWGRFGGPGAGRCQTSVLNSGMSGLRRRTGV